MYFTFCRFLLRSGVPQGFNIRPLLINIFINDLLQFLNCSILAFADDLTIYSKISNFHEAEFLQGELTKVVERCYLRGLIINNSNCCYILFIEQISLFIDFSYSIGALLQRKTSKILELRLTAVSLHINLWGLISTSKFLTEVK